MKKMPFTAQEARATAGLAMLCAIRMLGLFMVLPILALYSDQLSSASPTLIGVALGAYGITQAIMQIPFGSLSDFFGRKKIITIGMLLLLVGSLIAAFSTSIYGIIIGRAIQGSGAISGVIMALLADETRNEIRMTAMAIIGISIGISIGASMVIGPIIAHAYALKGVFLTMALMAIIGLLLLWLAIPQNHVKSSISVNEKFNKNLFWQTLVNPSLLRLNLSVFILHGILTALFIVLPIRMLMMGFNSEMQGWLYLPIMALAFIAMMPLIYIAESKNKYAQIMRLSILFLSVSLIFMFILPRHSDWLFALLWVFFVCFNLMEAMLPSIISRLTLTNSKGTALGIYSTSQFIGTSIGGIVGGLLATYWGINSIFLFCACLGILSYVGIRGLKIEFRRDKQN